MRNRTGDEGTVETVRKHLLDQRCRGVGGYLQRDPRVMLAHRLQRPWQVDRGKGFHRADSQFAAAGPDLAHRGLGLLCQPQQTAGVVEQHTSGRRQFQPAAFAEEQIGSEFLLEPADTAGDIRLHRVEAPGRGQDATFLDHGNKGSQGTEFHINSLNSNTSIKSNRL